MPSRVPAVALLQVAHPPVGQAEERLGAAPSDVVVVADEVEHPPGVGDVAFEIAAASSRARPGRARSSPAGARLRRRRRRSTGSARSRAAVRPRSGARRPGRPRWPTGSRRRRPTARTGRRATTSSGIAASQRRSVGSRRNCRISAIAELHQLGRALRDRRPGRRARRPRAVAVLLEPVARTTVEDRDLARPLGREVGLQHAAEQVVVAIPAALVVEGDDEQVAAVERLDRRALPLRLP